MDVLTRVVENVDERSRLEKKLWPKVACAGPDECWLWIAKARHPFGYGRVSFNRGEQIKAHRAVWALNNGAIPEGLCVLHRCDEPRCCNPKHLFLGTKADNTHDMMQKGRMSPPPVHSGDNHPLRRNPSYRSFGDKNGNSRAARARDAANHQ